MRNGQNDHCKRFFFHKINKNLQRKPGMKYFVHLQVWRHSRRIQSFFVWEKRKFTLLLGIKVSHYQFVIFIPLSYCFEKTIAFDVKALFARRPVSQLIKPGEYNKRILGKDYSAPRDFSWIENSNYYLRYYSYIAWTVFSFVTCQDSAL